MRDNKLHLERDRQRLRHLWIVKCRRGEQTEPFLKGWLRGKRLT
jgi:hypothetical protein